MKKLILVVIVLAIIIYFGYPYLAQLGHPEAAIPGLSEWLEQANDKIHVTVDGAQNLYVQAQKVKELIDIASWKEIEAPTEGTEAPLFTLDLGENTLTLYDGFAGIEDEDGGTKYYSMDPDTFEKFKAYIQENISK